MKKNHFYRFKHWIKNGFNWHTIVYLIINILIYILILLTLAFWLKDTVIQDGDKQYILKNTKSIPNSLTAANVTIFSLNIMAILIRHGFGSGFKEIMKNIFDTFNFKKQNQMLKKRHMSRYELEKFEKENPQKDKKIHGTNSYKSTSFIFWTLILLTIISQLVLIPFMI